MNFTSDNCYGAAPEVLDRLRAANQGAATSYGEDELTVRLTERMSELFEREVAVYPAVTGTAANSLALATLTPPHGAILCHADAHISADECGAPEFFSHGAKLVLLEGEHAKLKPETIGKTVKRLRANGVHSPQPATIGITQTTELGTCYALDEISAIAAMAKSDGLSVYMDGARFANAVAHLGCTPAEASWRAGVDVLSFGATKNGTLCAEAVVFFDRDLVRDFEYRRKKGGHLLSKMRFISAQLLAYLEDGLWLRNARHANALAQKLAKGFSAIENAEIAHPVEANAVFVRLSNERVARLRAGGAVFYDWAPPAGGCTLIRLVCSFATSEASVERLLELAAAR